MAKKIDFNKPLKWVLIAYAAFALVGVIIAVTLGVRLDINFKGGTVITYNYTFEEGKVADINVEDVKALVSENLKADAVVTKGASIAGNTYTITVSLVKNEAVTTDSQEALSKALQEKYKDNNVAVYSSTSVSPTLAVKFFIKALTAVLVVAILVIIYVGIRFRKIGGVSAGLTAFASLFLDVFVAFFTCTIFGLQIDSNFMAVILTILGYSLNDTIVVYDRVRENKSLMPKATTAELVNESLNSVKIRTIVTTVTTFLAVMMIVVVSELFGLTSLRSFAIPMAFGLVSGCFSSLFVSAPLWVIWKNHTAKKAKKA